MNRAVELTIWFFGGCLLVLVVTHAPGFAQATGAVFTGVQGMGNTLTGAGVGNAVYPAGTVVKAK